MINDLNPKEFRNIYIVCGATDMRCGINGLSAIIEQKYKMNVFIGKTLFMFCGHNAKIMKALLWEGDGFLMLTNFFFYFKVLSIQFRAPVNSLYGLF